MKKIQIKSYLDEILEQKIKEALAPQADSLEQMKAYGYLCGMKQAFYLAGDKKAEQRTSDAIESINEAVKEVIVDKLIKEITSEIMKVF